MTFSLQSPGDEQYNNGKTPHSCRDITNLSCFGFFNSLTAGAHRRIVSHSVGQNCQALLSFQLFKRSHKEKDEGEKILFLSHYTTEESPWDQLSYKIIQSALKCLTVELLCYCIKTTSIPPLIMYLIKKPDFSAELWYFTNEPNDRWFSVITSALALKGELKPTNPCFTHRYTSLLKTCCGVFKTFTTILGQPREKLSQLIRAK